MSNYQIGHDAEQLAAEYLKGQGYKILDINWKMPAAEIDIIAEKGGRLFFVEVKYRHTKSQGTGFDYITSKKLKHMRRAAEIWLLTNHWHKEVCLAALAIDGSGNIDLVEID